jgi:hypothetical protein
MARAAPPCWFFYVVVMMMTSPVPGSFFFFASGAHKTAPGIVITEFHAPRRVFCAAASLRREFRSVVCVLFIFERGWWRSGFGLRTEWCCGRDDRFVGDATGKGKPVSFCTAADPSLSLLLFAGVGGRRGRAETENGTTVARRTPRARPACSAQQLLSGIFDFILFFRPFLLCERPGRNGRNGGATTMSGVLPCGRARTHMSAGNAAARV